MKCNAAGGGCVIGCVGKCQEGTPFRAHAAHLHALNTMRPLRTLSSFISAVKTTSTVLRTCMYVSLSLVSLSMCSNSLC